MIEPLLTIMLIFVISIFIVLVMMFEQQRQINKENMSFWIHNEDRKLFNNISEDTRIGLSLKRSNIDMEIHSLFQFLGALYKQKKYNNIDDKDWGPMLNGFSFIVNSNIGKEYWHIMKEEKHRWPKYFIELGDSLIIQTKTPEEG